MVPKVGSFRALAMNLVRGVGRANRRDPSFPRMTRLLAAALRPRRLTGQVARQVGKLLLPECLPASDLLGAAKAVLLELGDCFPRPLGDEGDSKPRLTRQDIEARRLVRLIGAI